jgi:hypothetical protein
MVWLCRLGLKIQNLFDARFREDVMAAASAFVKMQMPQQESQIVKRDVGVRRTTQNLIENLLGLAHTTNLSQSFPHPLP